MKYTNEQHANLDACSIIIPELFLAIVMKKETEVEYNRLLDLNQSKTNHACATYFEYIPYYENGKEYYDENMREQIKLAWNAMQNAIIFHHIIHTKIMDATA